MCRVPTLTAIIDAILSLIRLSVNDSVNMATRKRLLEMVVRFHMHGVSGQGWYAQVFKSTHHVLDHAYYYQDDLSSIS